jgi:phosphatidate cytidylyltransferase
VYGVTDRAFVLGVYGTFTVLALAVALIGSRRRPAAVGNSVWRKVPTYVAIYLVIIAAAWSPKHWPALPALVVGIAVVAAWEIATALGVGGWALRVLPVVAGVLVAFAWRAAPAVIGTVWLATLAVAVPAVSLGARRDMLGQHLLAVSGTLAYVPVCLGALLWLWRGDPDGRLTVFLCLAVAVHDAMAQIVGQAVGQRQLAPAISPAKTIEGAFGGLAFAAVIGGALAPTVGWDVATGAVLGGAVGCAALAGDLTASSWKRALGVVQYSRLAGPHGGVLDRFDGLMLAAPWFLLLMRALGRA